LFILWRSISIQSFMVPHWLVQVLHPPQKFERPPLWSAWRWGLKKYSVEVTFNGMTSLLSFIIIYQLVQNVIRGRTQTDRQTDKTDWWFHKPHFPFKEKSAYNNNNTHPSIFTVELPTVHNHELCLKTFPWCIFASFSTSNPRTTSCPAEISASLLYTGNILRMFWIFVFVLFTPTQAPPKES
jgi:hypothetical protein